MPSPASEGGGARLATVLINNYNYGRFLRDAIDSALGQTYPRVEVVVVDDGSTDDSRRVIDAYGRRIVPVLKANGGQESAVNAGFAVSRGEVVCLLDSDDTLASTALERAVPCFGDPAVVKVHWPVRVVDERGRPLDRIVPGPALPAGDLLPLVLRYGPNAYATSGTCGSAWARSFLARVLPAPPSPLRSGTVEAYLSMLAPVFGRVASVSDALGCYRMHGDNNYLGRLLERLPLAIRAHEELWVALARVLEGRGIPADRGSWERHSWLHRLKQALAELEELVPAGATYILVDEDQWALPQTMAGRRRVPFVERDGIYWGPPPDATTAIGELTRLRAAGAQLLVFGWPAFWWLDHYEGLHRYLRRTFPCLLANDRLVVFDLRAGPPERAPGLRAAEPSRRG